MISIAPLVKEVSEYLVDQEIGYEYIHWSEESLLSYARLALGIVATASRAELTKVLSVPLVAGSIQTVPSSCVGSVSVLGAEAGGIVTAVREVSASASLFSGRLGCADCSMGTDSEDYKIESWSRVSGTDNSFIVHPPVPEGAEGNILVSCFVPPTIDSIDSVVDLADTFRPVIFSFMLYYAYGVDFESVSMREQSAYHFANGNALLQRLLPLVPSTPVTGSSNRR